MSNKKEQTPLVIHKALEAFIEKEDNLFIKIDSEQDLIRFRGSASDSNFFFHIKQHRRQNQTNQILISYQPFTEESVEVRTTWTGVNGVKGQFDIWHKILSGYNSTKTVFDDPIIEHYEDDYYSYFEIIDEEKNKPLEPSSIIPLYEHFEEIRIKLDDYKTEENLIRIEEIQSEIIELNENLTQSGRQDIAKKICKIWAKLTKEGIKYMKEFVDISRKHIMKEGVKSIFKLGVKGLKYIENLDIENLIN